MCKSLETGENNESSSFFFFFPVWLHILEARNKRWREKMGPDENAVGKP